MTPMTPEQRAEAAFYVPTGQNPAAPETVAALAAAVRVMTSVGVAAPTPQQRQRIANHATAVVRRLLDAERDIEALRRILATAITVADDNPDYGLTAGELLHLLTGSGLDLRADIEAAEQLRDAEQLAGAR